MQARYQTTLQPAETRSQEASAPGAMQALSLAENKQPELTTDYTDGTDQSSGRPKLPAGCLVSISVFIRAIRGKRLG